MSTGKIGESYRRIHKRGEGLTDRFIAALPTSDKQAARMMTSRDYLLGKLRDLLTEGLEWEAKAVGCKPHDILDAMACGAAFLGDPEMHAMLYKAKEGTLDDYLSQHAKSLGRSPEKLAKRIHQIEILNFTATEMARALLRKPEKTKKPTWRLTRAEILEAQALFQELRSQKNSPSKDKAYEKIAKKLSKKRRPVSKTTIRRICDPYFASQSQCVYGETDSPQRKIGFMPL